MLYLTDDDIGKLVSIGEVVESLRLVFRQADRRTAHYAPRTRVNASSGLLDTMGAVSDEWGLAAVKSYFISHGRIQFFLTLYAAGAEEPVAIMQAKKLGQLRTGAASALATDILASRDAETMGCIGTGYQAGTQVDGVMAVRHIERILVHSRSPSHMRKFADGIRKRHDVRVIELGTVSSEFSEAEVISCATNSTVPVLDTGVPGELCHINAIGGYRPDMVEIGPDLVSSCVTIATDLKEQAMKESGELISAVSSGEVKWTDITEMTDLVAGRVHKRKNASSKRTLFKSLGVSVEDLAAAKLAYDAAISLGIGMDL